MVIGIENAAENPNRKELIKNALKSNYGFLMIWGGMYLGPKITPVFYLLNTGTHLFLLAYTAYLCIDDLGPMSEALHFIVLLGTACTSLVNTLAQKRKLENLLEAIGSGFYDYEGTMDEESKADIAKLKEEANKRKSIIAKLFITGVMFAGVALSIFRPLLEFLLIKEKKSSVDGINRYVAVDCWYPLDAEDLWQCVISFILHYLVIYMTPGIIFGTDITFLCISEELCVQFKAVGMTLRRVEQRALNLCKRDAFGNIGAIQFEVSLRKCIRHSLEHHVLLIRLFQDFRDLNHYVLLWLMVGSTFLLCLSGILFVSDKVGLLSKMTFFLFLACELVHTFIFCWYAEQIQTVSAKIGDEFYDSSWIQHSRILKSYILIVKSRARIPLILSAGGFMDVNLNTYSNVLSNAYSYFNLLRAVQQPVKN